MKIKHFSIFNSHDSSIINWGHLRDDKTQKSYFIPNKYEDYINIVMGYNNHNLIKQLLDYCNVNKITKIISFGSGRCSLEYHLKINSALDIIVSDTNDSIHKINMFNIFSDAFLFNPLEDSFKRLKITDDTLVLLCRIDTEFDDKSFDFLFKKLNDENVKNVCFIPAELLTFRIFISEIYVRMRAFFTNKKLVFCGYARSKSNFFKIWDPYFKLDFRHNNEIYFLKK